MVVYVIFCDRIPMKIHWITGKICLSLFSYIRILKWQIGLRICIKQKNRKLIINKCWMIIEI